MTRRHLWMLLVALGIATATFAPGRHVDAAATGATFHFRTGWFLMAGVGQNLGGTLAEGVYTLQPGDTAYRLGSARARLQTGFGYWVYMTADGEITPSGGSDAPYQVTAPAGTYFLVGDPSGTQAATVTGADRVLIYDQSGGYQETSRLQPGQGAWVFSINGGMITITPSGGPTGAAAAPAALRNLQTVSGMDGYRFQVPAAWQQEPAPLSNIDVLVISEDRQQFAMVKVESLPDGLPNAPLIAPLNDYLQIVQAGLSDFVLLAAPDTTNVAGADSAAITRVTYTNEYGDTHISTILMARRSGTVYLFVLDVSGSFWNQNQDLVRQWISSFQIVAST